MGMSGDGQRRAAGDGEPESSGAGLRAVAELTKKSITAFAGVATLLAAIGAFIQPYTHSGGALLVASLATLAAVVLLAVGVALIIIYRNRPIVLHGWQVALVALLFVTAVVGVAATFNSKPKQGSSPLRPTFTSSPAVTPSVATSTPATPPTSVDASTGTVCSTDALVDTIGTELDSAQQSTRLSAITSLQKLIESTPADQCAAIDTLTAFIRKTSPATDKDTDITPDVQAALAVIGSRNPTHDGGATIDLHDTNLTSADLTRADLANADLSGANGADLTTANLTDANLSGADLADAYVGGATITGTDFSNANLTGASFYQTPMCTVANVPVHPTEGYTCNQ